MVSINKSHKAIFCYIYINNIFQNEDPVASIDFKADNMDMKINDQSNIKEEKDSKPNNTLASIFK